MGIIYFDICAIPLFVIILFVCIHRKMTKGYANRLFLLVVFTSLICTMADLGMEVTDNAVPLNPAGVMLCNVSTYVYFIIRIKKRPFQPLRSSDPRITPWKPISGRFWNGQ